MRRLISAAIVAAALAGGAAHAQVPLKPGLPSILTWTPEQQRAWYPAIETVYQVRTIKRGGMRGDSYKLRLYAVVSRSRRRRRIAFCSISARA